jgi:hypothetical protein
MSLHELANRIIAATILVLVTQTLEQTLSRMTLLRRSVLVRLQNRQQVLLDRPNFGSGLTLPTVIPSRLAITPQDLTNLVPRMTKLPRYLANPHHVSERATNPTILVHGQHP